MITITQFSLLQLKTAHDILSAANKEPAPAQPVSAVEGAAPAQADAQVSDPQEVKTEAPQTEAAPKDAPFASEQAVAAVAEAVGLDAAKVAHLVEAIRIIGKRMTKLKQVRVVQLEGAPQAAVKGADAGYILDMIPAPASQSRGRDDGRKGGPKGRDGKKGGKGGKEGARRGPGAPGGRDDNRRGAAAKPGEGRGDRPGAPRGPGRPSAPGPRG
jgi:ATP-dependent RNA helicase SUPV3L1/SUV3